MCFFWLTVIGFTVIKLSNHNSAPVENLVVTAPTKTEEPLVSTSGILNPDLDTLLAPTPSTGRKTKPTATYDPTGLEIREITAIVIAAQTHLLGFLDEPSTAQFPDLVREMDAWQVGKYYDVVTVKSHVTADDSSGRLTRYDFMLQMNYTTGDLTFLEMNGKTRFGSAVLPKD